MTQSASDAYDVAARLQRAGAEEFSCDTAFGDCDLRRPSRGHCLLPAMLFQDVVGGEVREGTVGGVPHYWNRVGGVDGIEFDLTADQFGGTAPRWGCPRLYAGKRFPRVAGSALPSVGDNDVVNRMYDVFRKRVVRRLRRSGHVVLASGLDVV